MDYVKFASLQELPIVILTSGHVPAGRQGVLAPDEVIRSRQQHLWSACPAKRAELGAGGQLPGGPTWMARINCKFAIDNFQFSIESWGGQLPGGPTWKCDGERYG